MAQGAAYHSLAPVNIFFKLSTHHEAALDLCPSTLNSAIKFGVRHKDHLLDLQGVALQVAPDLGTAQMEIAADLGGDKDHIGEFGLVHVQRADLKSVHVKHAGHFGTAQDELPAH